MISSFEFFSIGRGDEWDGNTVATAMPVGRRAGQNQQVFRLLFGRSAAVQFGKGVVGHAAPASGPWVRYDSDVLLYVTVFFVIIEGKVCK